MFARATFFQRETYWQLLVVTSGYQQLLVVTVSYQQLVVVTGSYQQLVWYLVVVSGSGGSHWQLLVVGGSYCQLLVVIGSYTGQLLVVTGGNNNTVERLSTDTSLLRTVSMPRQNSQLFSFKKTSIIRSLSNMDNGH